MGRLFFFVVVVYSAQNRASIRRLFFPCIPIIGHYRTVYTALYRPYRTFILPYHVQNKSALNFSKLFLKIFSDFVKNTLPHGV
nr:MAG TPA: hypothetical protein [Bacteriophage sp.]